MEDKSSLLSELRIDRSQAPERHFDRRWIWWGVGTAILLAAGVAGWRALAGPRPVPIQVATAQAIKVSGSGPRGASLLDASGYVVPRRQATVSAKVTGKVLEVLIEEGQYIQKDEIVARLDNTNASAALAQATAQLEQARANLNSAQVAFDNAEPTFQRFRKQLAAGVISAQDFDTAKASYDATQASLRVAQRAVDVAQATLNVAQRNLDDTVVRAPFSGVITVKAAQPGEIVSPMSAGGGFTRTGIGTIVDMDSLEVEVDVSESFINRVRPGQPARIQLNAYPEWSIPAEVIAVIPTADRAKATVKVRIGFKEKDERILPEMGARVSFLSTDEDSGTGPAIIDAGIVVPVDAVEVEGESGVVWLVTDDKVERRVVKLGARTPQGQTILSGLDAGTKLALGDLQQLSDGARIRIAEE